MTKKRMLNYVTVMAVIFGLVVLPRGTVFCSEVKLITILSDKDHTSLKLEPQDIKIGTKGVVVWSNGLETGQEVKVVFEDGKRCEDLVDPEGEFTLDPQKACFVTTYMPFGSTSSLVFPDAGKFEYKVVSEDGKLQAKGSITVMENKE